MCIAFWTCDDPHYGFVLASARDEYYARPTSPAAWHTLEDGTEYLSGLDLIAGGTWLAISKRGRLALLTNFTEPTSDRPKPSRGQLILDFLQRSEQSFEAACRATVDAHDLSAYAGFNLLLGQVAPSGSQFALITNRPDPALQSAPALFEAIPTEGTVGNGHYHRDILRNDWPKATNGLEDFVQSKGSHASAEDMPQSLYGVLSKTAVGWDESDPVKTFRDTVCIPPCRFNKPSETNAEGTSLGWYGNRCQTLILVDGAGKVAFRERQTWNLHDGDAQPEWSGKEIVYTFDLEAERAGSIAQSEA